MCKSIPTCPVIVVVVLSHTTTVVSRNDWGARPAKRIDHISEPVPYVIIHHSYQPAACWTRENCRAAMRSMQLFHQDSNGWNDIGYK